MSDRFSRSCMLYGADAVEKLRLARVAVCGAGAVGSFALEALARVGIGNLLVVDFDKVEQSNVNRQLFALTSTLGQKKTDVALARLRDINPDLNVQTLDMKIDVLNAQKIFDFFPAAVVDAVDDASAKTAVIAECVARAVPVFSSMGAARKRNPALVETADISKTSVCPLAAKMRRLLRAEGIKSGVTCVFSRELPDRETFAPSRDGVRKIMGSTPLVTGVFGLRLAYLAVESILGRR